MCFQIAHKFIVWQIISDFKVIVHFWGIGITWAMNKVFKFVFLKAFGFRKVPEPNSKIHIILRFPILKVKIYLGVMRLIPLHFFTQGFWFKLFQTCVWIKGCSSLSFNMFPLSCFNIDHKPKLRLWQGQELWNG